MRVLLATIRGAHIESAAPSERRFPNAGWLFWGKHLVQDRVFCPELTLGVAPI